METTCNDCEKANADGTYCGCGPRHFECVRTARTKTIYCSDYEAFAANPLWACQACMEKYSIEGGRQMTREKFDEIRNLAEQAYLKEKRSTAAIRQKAKSLQIQLLIYISIVFFGWLIGWIPDTGKGDLTPLTFMIFYIFAIAAPLAVCYMMAQCQIPYRSEYEDILRRGIVTEYPVALTKV